MTKPSDEEFERWKTTFNNEGIVYSSDAEYREAIDNLVGYFKLLIEMDASQKKEDAINDSTPWYGKEK